jgi:hypothetical protein
MIGVCATIMSLRMGRERCWEGYLIIGASFGNLARRRCFVDHEGISIPAGSPYVSNESELSSVIRAGGYCERPSTAPFAPPCTDITRRLRKK